MSEKASLAKGASTSAAGGRDEVRTRRLKGRVYFALSLAFLVWIAAMVNSIAFRHYQRWDWTSDRVFTLSDRSRAVLNELPTSVEIWLVLSSAEPNYQDLRELLGRYRAASNRIDVHFVDPYRDPGQYRLLAERFQLGVVEMESGAVGSDVAMVVAAGDRTFKIDRSDLLHMEFDPEGEGGGQEVDVRSEQAITGALLEVTQGRRTKVCLTQGHGEWTLNERSERDLGALGDQMRRDNLVLEAFATRGQSRVPEGCDAVFVVGPSTSFAPEEAALLAAHLRRGGNMLVALDFQVRDGEVPPSGLEEMLRDFGVRVDRGLTLELDPRHLPPSTNSAAGPFLATHWGEHAITRAFSAVGGQFAIPVVVDTVRSVRPLDEERVKTLISGSDASYVESDIAGLIAGREPTRDDEDLTGPVSLAVAAEVPVEASAREGEQRGGRLVVLGDADLFSPGFIGSAQVVNADFASAIIGHLTARPSLIELPGRRVSERAVRMTTDDVTSLGFRVIVLFPAAIFFLGFAVWWNRRS